MFKTPNGTSSRFVVPKYFEGSEEFMQAIRTGMGGAEYRAAISTAMELIDAPSAFEKWRERVIEAVENEL